MLLLESVWCSLITLRDKYSFEVFCTHHLESFKFKKIYSLSTEVHNVINFNFSKYMSLIFINSISFYVFFCSIKKFVRKSFESKLSWFAYFLYTHICQMFEILLNQYRKIYRWHEFILNLLLEVINKIILVLMKIKSKYNKKFN